VKENNIGADPGIFVRGPLPLISPPLSPLHLRSRVHSGVRGRALDENEFGAF